MRTDPSDALVIFGITGDLAYKKIFPALQALVDSHYQPVTTVEDFEIYLRSDARSAPAAQ